MSDDRWTIRGVPSDIREIVGQAHATTGMSASQTVRQAIREWAQSHPEALAEMESEDDLVWEKALESLHAGIAEQGSLIDELRRYLRI
jgi:hypothetical protein